MYAPRGKDPRQGLRSLPRWPFRGPCRGLRVLPLARRRSPLPRSLRRGSSPGHARRKQASGRRPSRRRRNGCGNRPDHLGPAHGAYGDRLREALSPTCDPVVLTRALFSQRGRAVQLPLVPLGLLSQSAARAGDVVRGPPPSASDLRVLSGDPFRTRSRTRVGVGGWGAGTSIMQPVTRPPR